MADRKVVVMGTSGGGMEALLRILGDLPSGFPAAVCIVQHIGANPSALPTLLGSVCALPVRFPEQGETARPGHVYVAPPDHHLLLDGERLMLSRGPKENHTRPAVDALFRSAALNAGPRVIGVVLTGALDDGAAGLQAIQECGGITVVQDPDEAQEPGMPRAALRAVRADHCQALEGMAALLTRLVHVPVDEATPHAHDRHPRLDREHRASFGKESSTRELEQIGAPATFVCPDCGGNLWEIAGSNPPRYRCHTGHGFSLGALNAAQGQVTEEALWAGVRALEDRELMLRKIAWLDRQASDDQHARKSDKEADRIREQLRVLRDLLNRG